MLSGLYVQDVSCVSAGFLPLFKLQFGWLGCGRELHRSVCHATLHWKKYSFWGKKIYICSAFINWMKKTWWEKKTWAVLWMKSVDLYPIVDKIVLWNSLSLRRVPTLLMCNGQSLRETAYKHWLHPHLGGRDYIHTMLKFQWNIELTLFSIDPYSYTWDIWWCSSSVWGNGGCEDSSSHPAVWLWRGTS